MAKPKDILAQLLSPAQAETLDAAGAALWSAAAASLAGLIGALPTLDGADGRLVMPDEIIGEFTGSHLVLPIELTTARDQAATAYAAVETADAAAFFGASAEDAEGQEQEVSIVAGALLGQLISALNSQVFGASPAGLVVALGDVTANAMPDLLATMDEPALALKATVAGTSALPVTFVLPGTFLDILAGAMPELPAAAPATAPAAANPATAGLESLGFTLTAEELEAAELFESPPPAPSRPAQAPQAQPLQFAQPQPQAAPPPQPQPLREPTPITAGPAAHRAMFAPLPEAQPAISKSALDMLAGLQMNVVVELGRTELTVSEVLGLGPGSVIELDRLAGEPVDILVNERLIARGEVVVVDENFGIRVVEVVRRGADAEERAG
ncbi:MAG: flagellar motor switch protein FliN [Dehalococcoidia bacterium]